MDSENKNIQINTFSGGINSDFSDSTIPSDQYRQACNLRYINNSSSGVGQLESIEGFGKKLELEEGETVIETSYADKYGIVFVRDKNNVINVYRFELDSLRWIINKTQIFGPCADWNIKGRLSIVSRVENTDNIKLYIADGQHQIMIMNVLPDDDIPTSINQLITNKYENLLPPRISNIIYGSLKSGKNQYSYQLFLKYGQASQISPASKMIPIANKQSNGSYIGAKEGDTTNTGVKVLFEIPKRTVYDLIRIYRIHYDKNASTPEIDIMYEGSFKENDSINKQASDSYYFMSFNDVQQTSISKITVQEYNSQAGIQIIPKVLESKNDYLFAGQIRELAGNSKLFDDINTVSLSYDTNGLTTILDVGDDKDDHQFNHILDDLRTDGWKLYDQLTKEKDCINRYQDSSDHTTENNYFAQYFTKSETYDNKPIKYYGGTGKNIDWKFITLAVFADSSYTDGTKGGSDLHCIKQDIGNNDNYAIQKYYIKDDGSLINCGHYDFDKTIGRSYSNPIIASKFPSLRRGEIYRFGIIFKSITGESSPVKWIADIRVPDICISGFEAFMNGMNNTDMAALPIGVEFTLHDIANPNVYSYEIVRCDRSSNDVRIVSQGVLSRPVIKKFLDKKVNKPQAYTPSGIISTNKLNIEPNVLNGGEDPGYRVDNLDNHNLYQYISPDVSYLRESSKLMIDKTNLHINPVKYIFGMSADRASFNIISDSDRRDDNLYLSHSTMFRGGITTVKDGKGFVVSNKISKVSYNSGVISSMAFLGYDDPNLAPTADYRANSYICNSISIINAIHNTLGSNDDLSINVASGHLNDDGNFKVPNISGNVVNTESPVEAMKYNFNYFKLYCQSNYILVNNHDRNNPNKAYENGHGYVVIKRSVYNQCNITNYKFADSLKWDSLATVKDGKASETYSDKITNIDKYNFCNMVCWYGYNELFVAENKDNIYFKKWSPYATGGSCMLITIDNEWSNIIKDKFYNNYILSDTIGTDQIDVPIQNGDNFEKLEYQADKTNAGINIEYIGENKDVRSYIYNSTLGTFICNITRDTIPYGGFSKYAKQSSLYYSYADIKLYNSVENKIDVFNGDTYINPFEYTAAHKISNNAAGVVWTFTNIYAIPLESSINTALDSGYTVSRNYKDNNVTWIQEEPSNVDNIYTQSTPQYVYNTAYSISRGIDIKTSKQQFLTKQDQYYNYRCRFSNKKENGEINDSWQTFLAANYIDLDPAYGKLTGLKTFNNSLVFFQEKAFGLLQVNERTTITDNNSHQLLLGSGGVLDRYDYISTNNGMCDDMFAYATTPMALYWIDADRSELCQYFGQSKYDVISKSKNINSYMKEVFSKDYHKQKIVYDNKYNEVLFGVSIGTSISFSETQQRFYSIYDRNVDVDGIYIRNFTLFNMDDTVAVWNNGNYKDSVRDVNLKFVVNNQYSTVKVFDNMIFGSDQDTVDSIIVLFRNDHMSSNYITKNEISNRYFDYRFAIPRGTDNLGNGLFGNRMRGKYVECDIHINPSDGINKATLQYFMTKYRAIWS